jgi:hypothetical protein
MFSAKKILTIIFILLSIHSRAQFFDMGQDPASVKWRMIKTKHFKVIYPREIEDQAQHVANMLEDVYVPLSASMKVKPVKISVVLHNRSVTSNAMVPWAPKRMEWYTTPGQDDYAQPWFDQLALHEFRHVTQYSKINTGFTKVLSYLFGQQITAAVFGAFVPMWFVEGDAVVTETAFSKTGRGRMPSFEMELRTQVLEKGVYPYDKAVFGSYNTFTPDRYVLGYHIIAGSQKAFSYDVWESAMDRTARMPYMVVPFSSGIHKKTRLTKVQMYKLSLQTLENQWKIQDSGIVTTKRELLSKKPNRFYSSYHHGSFMDNNTYLSMKSGMDDLTRLIRIDSKGKEKRLFTPGQYSSASLSFASNKIVWAETTYDPRWENRSYSVIKSYNILTHRTRQLTHRSRYFAPSLNHQGNKVVCVEQTIEGNSFIVILDAETGDVLNSEPAIAGDYIMTPSWSDKDDEVVYIALNRMGKRLRIWNAKGESKDLTQPSFVNIQQPKKSGDNVYFVGAYSGINNIYRLDSAGQIVRITSSRFGVTDPTISADGKEIIYSDYTAAGYKLVKACIDSLPKQPLLDVPNTSIKLYETVTGETKPLDFYEGKQTKYSSQAYLKFLHLFNFHSWGPLSIDADNTSIKPGLEIVSQDLLGTLVTSAGYDHKWNYANQQFYAKVSYRGWYPQFDFSVRYEMNKQEEVKWDVFSAQVNMKIPINLSGGKYFRSLQPQIGYSFANYIPGKNYPSDAFSGYYQALTYRLYGYNVITVSSKDINPRWGQMLDVRYQHTPMKGLQLGEIFSAESMLYFPGIGRHHSLNAYMAYQQINSRDGYFNDIIASPQGIPLNGFHQMLCGKFSYELPLFYPDWSIFSALYIKRFRAGLHYDQAFIMDYKYQTASYNSAGLSLLGDFHIARFLAPISLGCRATYTFYNKKIIYELIYSINFNQLYFKPRFSRMND